MHRRQAHATAGTMLLSADPDEGRRRTLFLLSFIDGNALFPAHPGRNRYDDPDVAASVDGACI
jgi:hypothetical protein